MSSPLFQFESANDLVIALGDRATEQHVIQINELIAAGLPPIVSEEALAVMLGINSGLVWSFIQRPRRHYRTFNLPKGTGVRPIAAPRVALKIVQKWLSVHLSIAYQAPDHVFGFVPGRSHLDAALHHQGAEWSYSADIENFFGSTPQNAVRDSFLSLGYDVSAAQLCASLTCFNGFLAQGAPTSPVLSNLCFRDFDNVLIELSIKYDCRVTRYADDIVFSGTGSFNDDLRSELAHKFVNTPWKIVPQKESVQPVKGRIKIHGLLIKPDEVRLTKGYRNKIRAYSHLLATKGANLHHQRNLIGHVQFARYVAQKTGSPSGISKKFDVLPSIDPPRPSDPSDHPRFNLGYILSKLSRIFGSTTSHEKTS